MSEEHKEALDHLGYEWWMFHSTWSALSVIPDQMDFVRNAFLESLVIHARGMIELFYTKNPRPDDWTVDKLGHGLSRQAMPDDVRKWKQDADKRIAHLTKHREISLDEWDVQKIADRLETQMESVKQAFGADFPKNWIGNRPRNSSLVREKVFSVSGQNVQHSVLGPTGPASPSNS